MRFVLRSTVLLVIMAAFVIPSFAWDDVGHKITAYIAWQRMSPTARENVIRILRAAPEDSQLGSLYASYGPEPEDTRKLEFFMVTASWADIVRDRAFATRYKKYHHSNWHYSDTFWKDTGGKPEILNTFNENGEAVERLIDYDKVIRDPKSSDADKAIAIAWMMHLTGDIHQPLHTSARVTDLEPKGDQGGNLFLLSPKGTERKNEVNLHWFWDSIVGRNYPLKGKDCERSYLEQMAQVMMKDHPYAKDQSMIEIGQYDAWAKETFRLVPTNVFTPDLIRNQLPSAGYRRAAFKTADAQLALAGYRLGETLNAVFGTAPAAR